MKTTWWKRSVERTLQAQRKRSFRPMIEQLETRLVPATTDFRSITGAGNNVANFGVAGGQLLRSSDAAYRAVAVTDPNGFFTPSMNGGSPFFVAGSRLVSNVVSNQATELFGSQDIATVNQDSLSGFSYAFGQFVDHDMDLSKDNGTNDFPIPADAVNTNDPIGSLAFSRSLFDPSTGTTNDREQTNSNTSFLDLSQVYGSTEDVAAALRTGRNGLLKTSPGADGKLGTKDDLLPFTNETYFTADQITALNMANDAHLVQSTELFGAGDRRANETTDLTALQTLFVRNHNRIAKELRANHPRWDDERLFQEARKLNIAQYQATVYNEFVPALLGTSALPQYTGYKAEVDAGISTEFSTIGYRFGHTLLNGEVERHGNNGADVSGDSTGDATVRLVHSFFNPTLINGAGVTDPATGHVSTDIGAVLKGAADVSAQATDVMAVSDIRNLLFGQGGPGEDLIARDLWRAHDHGIGTYNQVREAFHLAPITDTGGGTFADYVEGQPFHGFEQISSDPAVVTKLVTAYAGPTRDTFLANGKFAGDIDPFTAGLAEDHAPGSTMGATFTAILADQFTRLRDGDRFFYLNEEFSREGRDLLRQGDTLSEIIKANTNVTNLQANAFKFTASISGKVERTTVLRIKVPQAGVTVQLKNADGVVVATTTTDARGRYTFNQLSTGSEDPTVKSGVSSTGTYHVAIVVPDGLQQTTRDPGDLVIKVGGTNLREVDFGLRRLN